MRRLAGVLFTLAILFLVVQQGCKKEVPAPVKEMAISIAKPTAVAKMTERKAYNLHLGKLNPSLQKYVKRLYKQYAKNGKRYTKWSKLHQYILETHRKAEKQYHIHQPITRAEVCELVYGIKTYTARWRLDEDWAISYWTHESGFLDIIGDKKNKHTGKLNPPDLFSVGKGQVQLGTAYANLRARSIDPTGLTVDDLLYFRLMNMDVSACIMGTYCRKFGYKNGTKAYNAGEKSWHDGRSDVYYDSVETIWKDRTKWGIIPTATPTPTTELLPVL